MQEQHHGTHGRPDFARARLAQAVECALAIIERDEECAGRVTSFSNGKPQRETDATRSIRKEREEQEEKGDELEEGLEDTFPASDPPSATNTTTTGGPEEKKA